METTTSLEFFAVVVNGTEIPATRRNGRPLCEARHGESLVEYSSIRSVSVEEYATLCEEHGLVL